VRSRKGITPVVATVLLITISVAATATAYTFITGAVEDIGGNFEDDIREEEKRANSGMNIEYVYNSTDGFTFLVLRNTGTIALPVNESGQKTVNMYVEGQPQDWKYVDRSQAPEESVILSPEETLTINSTSEYPPGGESILFKFTGPYETSDSHSCYNTGASSC